MIVHISCQHIDLSLSWEELRSPLNILADKRLEIVSIVDNGLCLTVPPLIHCGT